MATMDSPASERNKEPILVALRGVCAELSKSVTSHSPLHVLEIAAGAGVHSEDFAVNLGKELVKWQPTDADQPSVDSINERCKDIDNVCPALLLSLDDKALGGTSNKVR
jgi:hypothetical protein